MPEQPRGGPRSEAEGSFSFGRRRDYKWRKRKELFRHAKREVSQWVRKSLKSLGREIGGFRPIVCFQWVVQRFASHSSRKPVLENFTSGGLPYRDKAGSGMAGFGRGGPRKTEILYNENDAAAFPIRQELVYPNRRRRGAKITLRQRLLRVSGYIDLALLA
jgi:hypothetical protein